MARMWKRSAFKKLMWYGIVKESNCKVASTWPSCGRGKEMALTRRRFGQGGKGRRRCHTLLGQEEHCVSIPTCHRTRESQTRTTGDTDRTHRVGALLPMPSCLGIGGHNGGSWQGHPRVHQCPHSGKAVNGPKQAPRDTTTTTKPRLP